MYLLLFEQLLLKIDDSITMMVIFLTQHKRQCLYFIIIFIFSFQLSKKMDEILVHIPKIRTIQLFDIFYKEEKSLNSKNEFMYEVFTSRFFKRINELEELLKNEENYLIEEKIITSKKENILKYISSFKEEHYNKVMNRGLYPTFLHFQKYDEKNAGGWFLVLAGGKTFQIKHTKKN